MRYRSTTRQGYTLLATCARIGLCFCGWLAYTLGFALAFSFGVAFGFRLFFTLGFCFFAIVVVRPPSLLPAVHSSLHLSQALFLLAYELIECGHSLGCTFLGCDFFYRLKPLDARTKSPCELMAAAWSRSLDRAPTMRMFSRSLRLPHSSHFVFDQSGTPAVFPIPSL